MTAFFNFLKPNVIVNYLDMTFSVEPGFDSTKDLCIYFPRAREFSATQIGQLIMPYFRASQPMDDVEWK